MKMKKFLIGITTVFVSVIALAADPAISNVTVQQQWPWSRLVDIDYVLTCDSEDSVDIVVEAYDGSSRLTLPMDSLSGDLYGVQSGICRIVWDPTATAYTNSGLLSEFRVALTPAQVPLYMILDLTKSVGEEGQTEYVYESDLTNGLWGAWVRNTVTNNGTVVKSVVWTGVTTNDIYKTNKLVLRRIPKGEFKMGGSLSTTLTKDFYAGVFEVTQQQWFNVMGYQLTPYFNDPATKATRPAEKTGGYDYLRGSAAQGGAGWPTNKSVYAGSFVGLLRAKTGFSGFDLPTEAQWEYACRAGTTTLFNDGNAAANISGANAISNTWLDALGRYQANGGQLWNEDTGKWVNFDRGCGPTNGTAIVGSYQPNAWGLYDMHGNVWEYCLDWWDKTTLPHGEDPVGAESGTLRVLRSGSWGNSTTTCTSAYRLGDAVYSWYEKYGCRIVLTLP